LSKLKKKVVITSDLNFFSNFWHFSDVFWFLPVWNLSYILHMHTFKQASLHPLIAFTTNALWCFECFVVYHKFVHVKEIDIF